jgi:chemotaxis protein histidine kinase CheA
MTEKRKGAGVDLSAYKALFLDQAWLHLSNLRHNLARLQDDPADEEAQHEAHRAAHTLKGMSATMRYETLAALANDLEHPFVSRSPLALDQIQALLVGCDEFERGLERLHAQDNG